MRRSILLIALLLLLLQGCQTAPRVVVKALCPSIPPLNLGDVQDGSFTERTANFLQGRVPEQTDSVYSFGNAKLPTNPQERR